MLTVEFTVAGIPCLGLNGGPPFKHSEAFSFQIATDDQEETDRYWNAIVGNGGQESQCGWCKDKWGISWQITPRVLTEAMAAGGEAAKRAFEAMMTDEEDRRRRDQSGGAGLSANVRVHGRRALGTLCSRAVPNSGRRDRPPLRILSIVFPNSTYRT